MKFANYPIKPPPKWKRDAWDAWYAGYLESPEWAARKTAVLRLFPLCQICSKAASTDAHHVRYDLVGREPLEHLKAICLPCHRIQHPNRTLRSSYANQPRWFQR